MIRESLTVYINKKSTSDNWIYTEFILKNKKPKLKEIDYKLLQSKLKTQWLRAQYSSVSLKAKELVDLGYLPGVAISNGVVSGIIESITFALVTYQAAKLTCQTSVAVNINLVNGIIISNFCPKEEHDKFEIVDLQKTTEKIIVIEELNQYQSVEIQLI